MVKNTKTTYWTNKKIDLEKILYEFDKQKTFSIFGEVFTRSSIMEKVNNTCYLYMNPGRNLVIAISITSEDKKIVITGKPYTEVILSK